MSRHPRDARNMICIGLVGLAGCAAVGPDYHAPSPAVPDRFADAGRVGSEPASSSSVSVQAEPDPLWWRRFGDAQLESLVDRAIAGNVDLEQALWRIAQARVQEQVAEAAGLPRLTGDARATREQLGLEGILKSKGVYDAVNRVDAPDAPVNALLPGLGADVEQGAKGLL